MQDDRAGMAHGVGIGLVQHRDIVAGRHQPIDQIAVDALLQPQTQAAMFTRHVLFRQPLEQALDAPRWLLGRTWGSSVTNLRLEQRIDGNLVDRLMAAGHDVAMLDEAYSDTMGHAGAVVLHSDGTLEGGHDPRADGGAAGI